MHSKRCSILILGFCFVLFVCFGLVWFCFRFCHKPMHPSSMDDMNQVVQVKQTLGELCPSKIQLACNAESNSSASAQWLWLEKYLVYTQFIQVHLEEEIEKASLTLNYQGKILQINSSIKPNRMNIQLAEYGEKCQPYIYILYKSNKQMRQNRWGIWKKKDLFIFVESYCLG